MIVNGTVLQRDVSLKSVKYAAEEEVFLYLEVLPFLITISRLLPPLQSPDAQEAFPNSPTCAGDPSSVYCHNSTNEYGLHALPFSSNYLVLRCQLNLRILRTMMTLSSFSYCTCAISNLLSPGHTVINEP